jgi:hypothetical protein
MGRIARHSGMKRYQGDAQWQRDFFAMAAAIAERDEHVAAGHQLREAGVMDEARTQLALAEECQERIEALEHVLRDL